MKGIPMKRLFAVAMAVAAITLFNESDANAQAFGNGYQFGAGLSTCYNFGYRGYTPREQLPYFAKYPPVYYSNIVARPVGISPYAVPAGVTPVEMNHAPIKNVTIVNPFFDGSTPPMKTPTSTIKKLDHKTTLILNPYMDSIANR